MAIRNSNVAVGTLSGTSNTLVYRVPTGFAFLLKSVVMASPGLVTFQYFIFLGDDPSVTYPLIATGTIAANETLNWSGWTALNASQNISLRSTVANTVYWIAGALLPFNAAL